MIYKRPRRRGTPCEVVLFFSSMKRLRQYIREQTKRSSRFAVQLEQARGEVRLAIASSLKMKQLSQSPTGPTAK